MNEERNVVLVISDNKPLLNAICVGLREFHTCSLSQPSVDSIDQFISKKPSCIVLDIDSDGMEGKTLLGAILETLPSVPIIMIASDRDLPSLGKLIEMGAYDYLCLPFERERLLLTVRNAIKSHCPSEGL